MYSFFWADWINWKSMQMTCKLEVRISGPHVLIKMPRDVLQSLQHISLHTQLFLAYGHNPFNAKTLCFCLVLSDDILGRKQKFWVSKIFISLNT